MTADKTAKGGFFRGPPGPPGPPGLPGLSEIPLLILGKDKHSAKSHTITEGSDLSHRMSLTESYHSENQEHYPLADGDRIITAQIGDTIKPLARYNRPGFGTLKISSSRPRCRCSHSGHRGPRWRRGPEPHELTDSHLLAFGLLGKAGKRAVRFSYASSEENIREAARRLRESLGMG